MEITVFAEPAEVVLKFATKAEYVDEAELIVLEVLVTVQLRLDEKEVVIIMLMMG
jgi:hypothetical protein